MSILIIEDDELWGFKLRMMLEQIGEKNIHICTYFDSIRVSILEYKPEVIIADIQLDNEHTIFEIINEFTGIPIIFITAYPIEEYQEIAMSFPNAYFIVKPFHQLSLKSLLDDISKKISINFENQLKLVEQLESKSLKIIDKFRQKRYIPFEDIFYIEGEGNYIIIYTDEKKTSIKRSLQKIKDVLDNDFIQIQKSYIVNINFITRVDYSRGLVYVNLTPLPLGRAYRKDLLNINLEFNKKKK